MTPSRLLRSLRRRPLWAAAAVGSAFAAACGPALLFAFADPAAASLPPAPLPMIDSAERLPSTGEGLRIRPVSTTSDSSGLAPPTTTLRLLPNPASDASPPGASARRGASASGEKNAAEPAKPEGEASGAAPQNQGKPFTRDMIRERPAASFRSGSPALSAPRAASPSTASPAVPVPAVPIPAVSSTPIVGPAVVGPTPAPASPLPFPAPQAAASPEAPKVAAAAKTTSSAPASGPALSASTARIVDRSPPVPPSDDQTVRANGAASVNRPTAIADDSVVPLGPLPQAPRGPEWNVAERLAGPAYSPRSPYDPPAAPTAAPSHAPASPSPAPIRSTPGGYNDASAYPQAAQPAASEWGRPVAETAAPPFSAGAASSFPERSAAGPLGGSATGERPLEVKNIAFCWKVDGFGTYEPIPEARFRPGQEILVYLELDHFSSEWTRQGHRTVTETACRIYDAEGAVVASRRFPTSVDLCRSRRRDYFQTLRFQLPSDLPPGDYHFELFVGDRIRNEVARGMAPFRLIAPQIVRGHGPAPTPAPSIRSSLDGN